MLIVLTMLCVSMTIKGQNNYWSNICDYAPSAQYAERQNYFPAEIQFLPAYEKSVATSEIIWLSNCLRLGRVEGYDKTLLSNQAKQFGLSVKAWTAKIKASPSYKSDKAFWDAKVCIEKLYNLHYLLGF